MSLKMTSNQNYCLTKIVNNSQLFGRSVHNDELSDLIEDDKFVGQKFVEKEIILPHSRSVYSCILSDDGKYCASNHSDNKIYVSNLQTAKVVNTLENQSNTFCLAFHPKYSHILGSGCFNGEIKIWDLKNNEFAILKVSNDYQVIYSICFHPFLDLICIALHNTISFWNWRTNININNINTGNLKNKIRIIKFDKSGTRLIVCISNELNSTLPTSAANLIRINLVNVFARESNINLNGLNNLANNNNNLSSLNSLNNLVNDNSNPTNNLINDLPTQNSTLSSLSSLSNLNTTTDSNRVNQFPSTNNNNNQNFLNFSISNPNYNRSNDQTNLRSEALINLSNAITDSLNSDNLLPDNLPSFSFLQRSYQQTIVNPIISTYNRLIRVYRRLENEDNNLSDNEFSNSNTSNFFLNLNNNNNNSNHNNNLNSNRNQNSQISDDLNVIVESINLIERFLNRFRQTNMDHNNDSLNNASLSSNRRNNFNYILRRRLSIRPFANLNDRQLSSQNRTQSDNGSLLSNRQSSERIRSIDETTNETNRRMNYLYTLIESRANRYNSSSLSNNGLNNLTNSNNLNSSTGSNNSTNLNNPTNSTNLNNSTNQNNQDIHDRFYRLLQHQSTNSRINQTEFNLNNLTTNSNEANQLTNLINRIQNSINIINSFNQLDNEELQELNANGVDVTQRLINHINCRDKLISLRNRIRLILEQSQHPQPIANSLAQYIYLVNILINYTDQMQRILVTDLRFTQLSRLYLMRTSSINNINQSNTTNNNISTSIATTSLSSINNTPSTSRGLKRSHSNDERTSSSDSEKNKKFKIPIVKISDNDTTDNLIDLDNEFNQLDDDNQQTIDNSNNESNQSTISPENRNQLRIEMNNLLHQLEQLNNQLPINQQQQQQQNRLNSFLPYLNYPIQRLNNPFINSGFNSFPAFNIFAHTQPNYSLNDHHTGNENLNHRIHCFNDFNLDNLPIINEPELNLITNKCKIYNESSIDISNNGELLACLIDDSNSKSISLCVYSLNKSKLGQLIFIHNSFNSQVISVSFSLSNKYLLVGYVNTRYNYISSLVNEPNEPMKIAQIFVLSESLAESFKPKEMNDLNNNQWNKNKDDLVEKLLTNDKSTKIDKSKLADPILLIPFKFIKIERGDDYFGNYLNSIKWSKEGLIIVANNGQLILLKGTGELEPWYSRHMRNHNMSYDSRRRTQQLETRQQISQEDRTSSFLFLPTLSNYSSNENLILNGNDNSSNGSSSMSSSMSSISNFMPNISRVPSPLPSPLYLVEQLNELNNRLNSTPTSPTRSISPIYPSYNFF